MTEIYGAMEMHMKVFTIIVTEKKLLEASNSSKIFKHSTKRFKLFFINC